MREVNVVVLPGDGIGPEVIAEAIRAVEIVAADAGLSITWREELMGGCSIDAHGTALTDDTLRACQEADAVFLGAVGGPKWDTTDPAKPRPEQGLLGLRAGLGLFANLRPVKPLEALWDASPLRRERIAGTDLLVVRELTGGSTSAHGGGRAIAPSTPASTRGPRSSASPRPPLPPPPADAAR